MIMFIWPPPFLDPFPFSSWTDMIGRNGLLSNAQEQITYVTHALERASGSSFPVFLYTGQPGAAVLILLLLSQEDKIPDTGRHRYNYPLSSRIGLGRVLLSFSAMNFVLLLK